MRITRDQAAENRQRVVDTAAKLFRDHGFDGVSVAEMMKAAGFTHGGFYNHFGSKEELMAEALHHAFTEMAAERARARGLDELIANYLSEQHRRHRAKGCPAAALAGEAARGTGEVRAVFADGVQGMIQSLETRLPPSIHGRKRRRAAIDLLCTMVGALTLARAVPDHDGLAREILKSAHEHGAKRATPTAP